MTSRTLILLAALMLVAPACASSGASTAAGGDGAVDGDGPDAAALPPQGDVVSEDVAASDVMADVGTTPSDAAAVDSGAAQDSGSTLEPDAIALPTEGACLNEADEAALEAMDAQTDMMAAGMACYDMAGGPGQTQADEVVPCLVEALVELGFSEPCGLCMAENILCLQEHCMSACMGLMTPGGDPAPCTACLDSAGCTTDIVACSGLDPQAFSF